MTVSLQPIAALFIAIVVPCAIAILCGLLSRHLEKRERRRLPISDKILHGPGEHLRRRIEKTSEDIDGDLVGVIITGPLFIATWALFRIDWRSLQLGWFDALVLLAALGMLLGQLWKLYPRLRARRRMREGLLAERYVAQQLDRLASNDCRVFHDVPADGFNLDHVVIAPHAVWCVETKSVRKEEGPNGHRVRYDGKRLVYPRGRSSKSVEQAQRQARWLADYLRKTLQLDIPVRPALALPGWYIQPEGNSANAEVRVFNPKGRGAVFMAAEGKSPPLSEQWRAMVARALEMRFPDEGKQG